MIRQLVIIILFCTILFSPITLNYRVYFASASNVSQIFDNSSRTWSMAWNHTYTDSNLQEADSVVQTTDGGFLLAGKTPLNTSSTIADEIALLKVDSFGNIQWKKTFDAVGNSLSKWLIASDDNGYALAGQQNSSFWLAKIDKEGNLIWNQTYMGEGFSWVTSLTRTNDGGYALTGQTGVPLEKIFLSSSEAEGIIWIVKTDSLGNKQWNKTFADGIVNSIIQTSDYGYALATNNLQNFCLIKTDSNGDLQWNKTYGTKDNDAVYSVVQTEDGGYALGGWMWLRSNGGSANFAIVKTDASGIEQWTKYYGAGFARYMIQTSDGGFALAGNKLVKIDSVGNEQWNVSLGAGLTCQAYSVSETRDGNYVIAGSIVGEEGASSAFLAKINSDATQSSNPTPQGSIFFSDFTIVIMISVCLTISVAVIVYLRTKK